MSSSLSLLLHMLTSLALLFILIDPSYADKHSKLNKVCSKTNDQNLCFDLMRTNLRSSENIDYKAINKNAIELAYNKATDVYRNLKDRVDDTSRRFSRGLHDACYKGYANAAEDLEPLRNNLGEGDHKQIEDQVKVVVDQLQHCKSEIRTREYDESYLAKTTKEFEILCDVIKYSAKHGKRED